MLSGTTFKFAFTNFNPDLFAVLFFILGSWLLITVVGARAFAGTPARRSIPVLGTVRWVDRAPFEISSDGDHAGRCIRSR